MFDGCMENLTSLKTRFSQHIQNTQKQFAQKVFLFKINFVFECVYKTSGLALTF
jgi:hypothetical protein